MTDADIDKVMKAYANDAVAVAGRRGVVLDFTEESLARVDELLGRESFIGKTPRTPESDEDEKTLWSCSKAFGAYVGEVVIRTMGGTWIGEPIAQGGTRPAILVKGVKGFPADKVWKRLTESEFDALDGYCRVLRHILLRQSDGRADGS